MPDNASAPPDRSAGRPKILWIDDDEATLSSARRLFRDEPFELVATQSAGEAYRLLGQSAFAAVISDQTLPNSSGIEILEAAKRLAPHATRMLLTGRVDSETLEDAVNKAAVFRFVSKPWDNDQLKLDVRRAVEHHRRAEAQARLLKEAGAQNRKLDELASGLESMVVERTKRAEHSKDEAESQQARMRELVRFIKDLSTLVSVDELMGLMRKELKGFHELRSPALGYMLAERTPRLAFFQGKQAVERKARRVWSTSHRLRLNDLEDRTYLANEFGRPFVKTLAVPLKRRSASSDGQEAPATLFFEHALPEEKVEDFLGFIGERAQPLAIALDRILLEDHLKRTSLQWAETFDGIRDPIAIVDVDYRIVRANRHFRAEGFETRCHKIFAGLESPCRGCPAAEALESGQPKRGLIKRGERVFEARSYPIRLKGDTRATNVINHYVDVTAARDLQSRLVQNEKMAAVGLLAGNIAHELNNPLTGIRSLAQVLLAEIPEGERLRDDVAEVEKAAWRSQKIIENLLDFSRGAPESKQSTVNLDDVVSRTLPMLKTAMREHRVELRLEAGEGGVVRAEPHLLQQVVFNLVNNACQAMQDAGSVTIETATLDSPPRVELRVRDTGVGVPPEMLESIFEPFFTTKSEGQGTGLGLSMSRQVIQQFGGEIRVASEIGKGSEFVVRLPIDGTTKP